MCERLLEQLYNNRLLRTKEEFENFEKGLNELSEVIEENDIPKLCMIFDDETKDDEVMFGLLHLIESFSSEKAFRLTVMGVSQMLENTKNWAKIIIYRCLNDNYSRTMLKKAIESVDVQTQKVIKLLLDCIKKEDYNKFGMFIDEVLGRL
ncbi:hypothetical protein D3Z50_21495 [Clostridiaceae bacterium]|nr:hypothetical protein [Clostridiaceae bacterium]